MTLNSLSYFIFLPVVVIAYYLINVKFRWLVLLTASYFFYLCLEPLGILLIIITTLIHYCNAILMGRTTQKKIRLRYLFLSLISGLGLLFLFKYYNFFADSVNSFLLLFNSGMALPVSQLFIPIGISFYTLQSLGYILDIYKGRISVEKHLGVFAVYVSYFPLILSGPIERSTHLLPQLYQKDAISFRYSNISQGVKFIIWGLFFKFIVADRSGLYVNAVYDNIDQHSGLSFMVATIFYSFQLYGDFAGYSLLAIGSAKLMGIDIIQNFNRPYFAHSVTDFWRRWHISLSTWLRDYIFLPLAYSISRKMKQEKYLTVNTDYYIYIFSILITFTLCGLWHGASWTFVVWGFLHAFYLAMEHILKIKKRYRFYHIIVTYILITFSWIFFRADSLNDSIIIIKKIITEPGKLFIPPGNDFVIPVYGILGIILLLFLEAKSEFYPSKFLIFNNKNVYIRIMAYSIIISIILSIGVFDGGQFIYVQF